MKCKSTWESSSLCLESSLFTFVRPNCSAEMSQCPISLLPMTGVALYPGVAGGDCNYSPLLTQTVCNTHSGDTRPVRTGEWRVQSCPLFHLSWSKQDKSIKFNCPFPTVRYYANACYCLPIKISSNLWFNLKWWHKHENFFAFGNIPFGGMGLLVFPQSLEIKTWDRWELSLGIGVN